MNPETWLIEQQDRAVLDAALAELSPRNAEIMRQRFGIEGDPMFLHVIGVAHGIHKERVRQVICTASRKLAFKLRDQFPELSATYRKKRAQWHEEDRWDRRYDQAWVDNVWFDRQHRPASPRFDPEPTSPPVHVRYVHVKELVWPQAASPFFVFSWFPR